ncbi:MAG TPA: sigma-70 family RNA polymerase sigma factor [Streptosporangiaceae bacterium]|nr:sigma-70 family RNA polymerase sigma factor [Streptosporangiaceae bacterium]
MAGIPGEAGGSGDGRAVAEPVRGDPTVTDLFRDHHLELVRLALVMVGDLATAEDVVQDAFEHLHRGWHGLRQPAQSLAYVRASVINGCRSVHRRSAVARKHAPRLAIRPDAAAADEASASDDRGELIAALRSLPRRQREVLVLRYYADLSVAEIAEVLRLRPGSVRAANSRGLAALASALREG